MRPAAAFAVLFLAAPAATASTIHVPGDQPTIQAGIDAAAAGDVVELAAGTFTGDGNRDIDFRGKAITVRSASGDAGTCIIDCQASAVDYHRGFIFDSGETTISTLEGVTITCGHVGGDDVLFDGAGGGVLIVGGSSPTLANMVLLDNTAMVGGGLFIHQSSSPVLIGCAFVDNTAWWGSGGGIGCYEFDATVTDCVFRGNAAHQAGGGMACSDSSPVLTGCSFEANSLSPEGYGAGFECFESTVELSGCVFADNAVSGAGGALCAWGWSAATLTNCTFANNADAGLVCLLYSSMTVERSIVAYGLGGPAVQCDGTGPVALSCSDAYGNTAGDWVGCIAGQAGVNGNFSAAPLFCDAEGGDFTLSAQSPCLPGNHPDGVDCGLIGALDEGCGTVTVKPETWARIKSRYRTAGTRAGRASSRCRLPATKGISP